MPYILKSKTDKYITPPELYNELNNEFGFDDFDPCPIDWEEGHPDGLVIEWANKTFVNPPYSNVAKWIKKAHDEWKKGKLVVMLINAKTDTKAFHEYIYHRGEIRFLKGRVKFIRPGDIGKPQPSPHPSMIVIFKPQ